MSQFPKLREIAENGPGIEPSRHHPHKRATQVEVYRTDHLQQLAAQRRPRCVLLHDQIKVPSLFIKYLNARCLICLIAHAQVHGYSAISPAPQALFTFIPRLDSATRTCVRGDFISTLRPFGRGQTNGECKPVRPYGLRAFINQLENRYIALIPKSRACTHRHGYLMDTADSDAEA
ncbi:hypothetical protein J6590_032791 [Homalodisca vitripennis]|nr:hypothetical protein J6590_032791 [Homalodisca vitripennis]